MWNRKHVGNGHGRPIKEDALHKIVVRALPDTKAWADSVGKARIRDLIAKAMEDKIYG